MQTGIKIQKYRLKKRMTQKELGEAVGLTKERVAQYECCVRNPKIDCLEKFAEVLGVSVSRLKGYQIETVEDAEEILNDIVLEFGKDFIEDYLKNLE